MLSAADLRNIGRFQRERALRWVRMKRPFTELDGWVREQMAAAGDDAMAMTQALVRYFWRAHQHYRHQHGTLAYYPGWPSIYGATNDAIEGVTRTMPLWAAYSVSLRADADMAAEMRAALRQTLVNGTDPTHPGYWGNIDHRSTLICEAADVALALWLVRETVWAELDPQAQGRVLAWLGQVPGKRTADNNWHLFVVLVDAVLSRLAPAHRFSSEDRLQRIRDFQIGDGCFTDGPGGAVDFYNAWGFHYTLFWLGEIRPDLLDDALHDSLPAFCDWFQWLFTPEGLPLWGRSLCYRFATSTPLLALSLRDAALTAAPAMNAWAQTWRFFVREGALRAGRPTQGVFGEDQRWLDPYSGQASAFWGLRSMVLALPLVADRAAATSGDAGIALAEATMRRNVVGQFEIVRRRDGDGAVVCVHLAGPTHELGLQVASVGWRRWLRQTAHGLPARDLPQQLRGSGSAGVNSKLEAFR